MTGSWSRSLTVLVPTSFFVGILCHWGIFGIAGASDGIAHSEPSIADSPSELQRGIATVNRAETPRTEQPQLSPFNLDSMLGATPWSGHIPVPVTLLNKIRVDAVDSVTGEIDREIRNLLRLTREEENRLSILLSQTREGLAQIEASQAKVIKQSDDSEYIEIPPY